MYALNRFWHPIGFDCHQIEWGSGYLVVNILFAHACRPHESQLASTTIEKNVGKSSFFLVLLKKKTLFYLIDIDFFTLYSLLIDSVSTSVRSLPSSNRILWNSQHLSIEPAFHFDQITLGAITNWLEVNLKLNFTTSWPQRRISSMQSFPSYTWLPNVTLNNGQLWSIARWIGNVLEPRSRTACLEFYIAASIGNILTISYIWLIISS